MSARFLLFGLLSAACVTVPRSPARHRGFPPACVNRPPVRLVKFGAPPSAAELGWARDFADAYGLVLTWSEPRDLPPAVVTPAGPQLVAEELIAALDDGSRPPVSTVVVGLTDKDLFIRGKTDWVWAFGLYDGPTAIVSTARMDPTFHRAPPDDALRERRLSKHLARVLGSMVCGLPRTGPPYSEMRREVAGLAALDQIEESNWELGPVDTAAPAHPIPAAEHPASLDSERLQADLAEAGALIKRKQQQEALVLLGAVLAQYEAAYGSSSKLIFCAQNLVQTLFYAQLGDSQRRETMVLDLTWATAWFMKGFALADLKRYAEAETALVRAVELAPQCSQMLSELGFAQQSQRRPRDAIDTFERALLAAGLADEAEQDRLRARALRGIGFNRIELGELDEAEKSFRESLRYEPDDRIAAGELEYIEQQRAKRR